MAAKRKKELAPVKQVPQEMSQDHRTALASAYKDGRILAWKQDVERGFCLTLRGRPDEYVQGDLLTRYLDKLKAAA